MSLFRTAPVTTECIIVCISLFVICSLQSLDGESMEQAQRQLGAAISLPPQRAKLGSGVTIQTWRGPADLWKGQWWRIPVSAFHHSNAIHLFVNCLLAWLLGVRLERRWGSLCYLMFLAPAVFVPFVAQFVTGSVALGFSGALCAVFGALIAIQQDTPSDDDFSEESIQVALGLILLGIPATALGLMDFANVAHVAGVVYGWFTAWILCGPLPRTALIRPWYATAHLMLIPVFWLASHPIGNGQYLWFLAEDSPHKVRLLQLARDTDPMLSGVWLQLADSRTAAADVHGAWSSVIQGLSFNPTDVDLIDVARRIWLRLKPGQDRTLAENELQRVFGKQAPDWSDAIRNTRVAARATPKSSEPTIDPGEFPLDRPIELQWSPKSPANQPVLPIDPERPDSAVEGIAL